MRKGTGVEMRGTERERRARQLRLVLQCAGPGSVTGSRTNQCQREGRPHGGYKGMSNKYPLSRSGFDKQEFMEEVKNSVNAQYREEQKCRTNSPQWLPAANKEKNHTGEQPLILQSFLAANKQEQVDGVLPAPNPITKRQSQSANMYRDDPDYFCRGNSTHQYLTATEMPGQSERLVDLAHGRPTRTSLLRVRQRTKSAPGVRAIVEIKTHLHKQQHLAAKTEDRYKSVDVPQDLLPVTDGDETVRQFLIGARYNRQDPLHCFKTNVPAKDNPPSNVAHLRGSVSSLNLTESCELFGSESNLSELAAQNQDPPCPKSAWSVQDEGLVASKGNMQSTTPAPTPSPANRSQETFLSKRSSGSRKRPKMRVIDRKTLKQDSGQECCIMCKSEEFPRHYQHFAPGSHFMRVKDAGKEDEEGDWYHNKDHMMVQQYHLRIMGIKYGVTSGHQAPPAPRSNLLYTTKRFGNKTELPFIKQARNIQTNNKNNSGDNSATKKAQDVIQDRPSSNSSKISVKISTHTEADEDGQATPQDTPRADATQADCAKEDNSNQVGEVVINKETDTSKEVTDMHRSDETSEENAQAVTDDAQDGGEASGNKDTNQEEPHKVVSAKNIKQDDDDKNAGDITDTEPDISKGPGNETQDTSLDDEGDNALKENNDLGDDAREDSTDVASGDVQVLQKSIGDVSGEDTLNNHPLQDGDKEQAESTENQLVPGEDGEATNK